MTRTRTTSKFPRIGSARGSRALFAVLLSLVAATLRAAPDTVLLHGPTGTTNRADLVFGWTGIPDDPTAPLRGFRYSLDDAPPTFTQSDSVAFYGVPLGEHRFRVAAVNARLEEDAQPAERLFTVTDAFAEEVEPNDAPTTATDLPNGTEMRGVSGGFADVDTFKIPVPNALGQATLTFRRPTGGLGATTIEVFRGDPALNDLLATLVAAPANSQRVSVTFGTPAAVYYVRVRADAVEAVASRYALTVTGSALPAGHVRESEPNGSAGSPNEVTLSDAAPMLRFTGATNGEGDADWLRARVDVAATRLLRMTLSRAGAGGETTLDAFVGTPPTLERQIVALNANTANDQFATFQTGVTLGDLWIKVNHAIAVGDAAYTVTLALSQPMAGELVEVEPNGANPQVNPRSPNALPLDATLVGTSWNADVDWFRLDMPRAGTLTLSFERPSGAGSTRIRLFNANQAQIAETTANTANSQRAILALPVTAGALTVELSATSEPLSASYRIRGTLSGSGILDAAHSATRALRRGETLSVRVTAPAGGQSSFRLDDARVGIPLFDDGAHDDGAASDGVYAGTYIVGATDELRGASVVVTYRDNAGSESSRTLAPTVTLDGVPPTPVTGVTGGDRPNDDGFWTTLRWNASNAADFAEYRVYLASSAIASVAGRTPVLTTRLTTLELPVDRNNENVFFAVTATDAAGNESSLGATSATGDVRALDNRRPEPVTGVRADDTPDDFGGQITVSWNASLASDFGEYRLYVDNAPIEATANRTPAARVADPLANATEVAGVANGAALFVAVTALDRSGNESPLGAGSVAGPATPAPNAAPDASPLRLRGPVGVVRSSSATFFWNRFDADGTTIAERYGVELDGRSPQLTGSTSATFTDLAAGRHTVRVSVPGASLAAAQTFVIEPSLAPELEPNDSVSTATPAAANRSYQGVAGAESDLYRLDGIVNAVVALTGAALDGAVTYRLYRDFISDETLAVAFAVDVATRTATVSTGAHGGRLYVQVVGTGAYVWSAQAVEPDSAQTVEREPNGSAETPTTATLDGSALTLRGASHADGDRDAFVLPVTAAGDATLTAYRPTGSGRTTVQVTRRGAPVAALELGEGAVSKTLSLRVAPDTYGVVVQSDRASAMEYQIAVALAPPTESAEIEPNDRAADANPLPTETAATGGSWKPDDVDVYRVAVDRRGTLVVDFARPGAVGETTLRLENAADTTLASATASPAEGGRTRMQAGVPAGIYFVRVVSSDEGEAPYRLTAFAVGPLEHSATDVISVGDAVTASVAWKRGGSVALNLEDAAGNVVRRGIPATDAHSTGVYTSAFALSSEDASETLTLSATLRFGDAETTVTFADPVRLDASPPTISAANHDARTPLKAGDALSVTASSSGGLTASFDIARPDGTVLRRNLPLLDDGTAGDAAAEDGIYSGRYLVASGDNVRDALVLVRFRKAGGQTATRSIPTPVTFDTTPPSAATGARVEDVPNDEGGYLRVRWDAASADDFSRYLLYAERSPIVSVRGLTPVAVDLFGASETETVLEAANETPFYVAVVVVDRAGNASPLATGVGGSVAGPSRARDNLAPEAITGVRAFDRPNDTGRAITVAWEPSFAPDFAEYRVYLSDAPFGGAVESARQPVARLSAASVTVADAPTPSDDAPLFVAVVAVDATGNVSALRVDSVAGPVASTADAPHSDAGIPILAGPIGASRFPTALFRWSRFAGGIAVPTFRVRLDGAERITQATELLLSDLREGERRFSVEPLDGSLPPSERVFRVEPLILPESEPNDSPASAPYLPLGIGVEGTLDGADDTDSFRVAVPSTGALTLVVTRLDPGETTAALRIPVVSGDAGRLAEVVADGVSRRDIAALVPVSPGELVAQVSGSAGRYRLALSLGAIPRGVILESEPNDIAPLASPTPSDAAEIVGSLASDDDNDWFRFDFDATMTLDIALYPAVDAELVQAGSGTTARAIPTATGGSATLRAGVRAGTYFLRVTGAGGTVYAFRPRLTLTPSNEVRELEPNGSPNQATRVASSATRATGALDAGDADWFRLELPVGNAATLRWTTVAATGASGTLRLFASALGAPSTQVAEASFQNDGRAALAFPTRGGIYYAQLESGSDTAFDYAADIALEPKASPPDAEYEPNDSTANASPLRIGTPLAGFFWRDTDADVYRIEIEPAARGYLVVSVEGIGVTGEVLDAAQQTVAVFAPPSVESFASVAAPATSRLFFARLRGAVGAYRVGALRVVRAEHNAGAPLGVGGAFSVAMEGQSEWSVSAEIGAGGARFELVEASPGTYTGEYVVRSGDNAANATVELRIAPPDGIVCRLPLAEPLTFDTTPPAVRDVSHNAAKPLKAGDTLAVTARSESGATASFEVSGEGFLGRGELFDDGSHNDGGADDGAYSGSYVVGSRDNVRDGVLRVRFSDEVGNASEREANRRVAFDTTPPFVESVRHDGTRTLKTGDVLTIRVTGEPGAVGDFTLTGVRENAPLYDNGTQGDAVAGDGDYIAAVLVREGDNAANAVLTARLTDLAGNVTTVSAPLPVGVDTTPPVIASVTHNATQPLRKGDKLTVRLTGEPDGTAFFDIGEHRRDIPLFDDGSGDDTVADDGVYANSYIVADDDDITDALVVARLADASGNVARRAAAKRVTLDAIPPEPVTNVSATDVSNDEGNRIRVAWKAVTDVRQFHRYQIYRQSSPIRSVKGLLPATTALVEPGQSELVLDVPANGVGYYFAVTTLDATLNESALAADGSSTAGPVRASDDIAPAPVSNVTAVDAPEDNGKALVVAWQSENDERDFGGYAVYVSPTRLTDSDLLSRTPAKVFQDRTVKRGLAPTPNDTEDVYVVVVATDVNGNRSAILSSSVAGPVRSADNERPEPVLGVDAADAPGDNGGKVVVSWRLPKGADAASFEVYRKAEPIRTIEASDAPVALADRASLPLDGVGSVEIATLSDESETYVAVVAVDGGGNRSLLADDSTAGPVRSVANLVRPGAAALIRAGFDERASVSIPVAAARAGMRVDILRVSDGDLSRRIDEANANLADANIDETVDEPLRDTVLLFQSNEALLSAAALVSIGYPALESPEIAADLRLFRLGTASRASRWELAPGVQRVDAEAGLVSAETRTLGVFRVARLLLPRRLDKALVYPNPFEPERDRALTFRNLTRDASVDIFTLDARRVRTIAGDGSGSLTWDGRNDNGDLVASGLYLYLIRGANDHRSGQIFVRR